MKDLVQLSVFLENRPGRIAHIARIFAGGGVNMVALSLAETEAYGIVRMLVDDPEKAEVLLSGSGMTCVKTPVLGVKLDNKPGSMARVLEVVDRESINIEYLYAVAERFTAVVFRFQDNKAAQKALEAAGFEFITTEDLHA